jgi:hypothetical protein
MLLDHASQSFTILGIITGFIAVVIIVVVVIVIAISSPRFTNRSVSMPPAPCLFCAKAYSATLKISFRALVLVLALALALTFALALTLALALVLNLALTFARTRTLSATLALALTDVGSSDCRPVLGCIEQASDFVQQACLDSRGGVLRGCHLSLRGRRLSLKQCEQLGFLRLPTSAAHIGASEPWAA